MVNPSEAAMAWSRGMLAAGSKIKDGVSRVTESPMAKAAQKAEAYVAGVQQAVQDGRWQAGLLSVSLEDWKQSMLQKGVANMQTGVKAGESKVRDFMQQFLPFAERVAQTVRAMPSDTLEQRLARMVENARQLSQFRRVRGRS